MRRRGFTPESIRNFCEAIGIAKRENMVDIGLLEFYLREHLNVSAKRAMAVLEPLKLVITNYKDGKTEEFLSENGPEETAGSRSVPFSRELWVEQEDFMELPAKKWFRLAPGAMVRLKSAYIVKCNSFEKDANGNITQLNCTYFPESKSGSDSSGLQVKGTIHWVSAAHALQAEVRLYDRLFKVEDPSSEEGDFKDYINPDSLKVVQAFIEPSLKNALPQDRFQFLRKGYFCVDKDATTEKLVFNRTTTLKDTWAKEVKKKP